MLSKKGQWEENGMINCCANHSSPVTKTAPKACVKGFEASLCWDWEVVEPLRGWSLLWRSQVTGVWIWIGYWDDGLFFPLRPGHPKVNDLLCVFFHHKAPTTDLKAAEPASFGLESLKIASNISLHFFKTVYFRICHNWHTRSPLDLKKLLFSTGQHLECEYQLLLTWKQLKGKSLTIGPEGKLASFLL